MVVNNAIGRRSYADTTGDEKAKKDKMAQLASMQRISPTSIGVYTGMCPKESSSGSAITMG
jgi:hypothetical protein